jgi:peptide/nickel transport system permease protein
MARQVLTTVGVALLTLWSVSLATFFGLNLLPGDEARILAGQYATPSSVAILRHQLGLNQPIIDRYVSWLSGLLHGHLGRDPLLGNFTVLQTISGPVRNTLVLAAVTIVILVPLSILLGVVSAVRRDGVVDTVISSTSLALVAVPEFVIGAFLVLVFAVWAGLFPAVSLINPTRSVLGQPGILVLPVLTLLVSAVAGTTRMVRACMINVLSADYIQLARLKGVPERTILLRHALPNALGPVLQVFALNVAWLAGGVVIVENVFQYPGLGSQLVASVATRDVVTVEAIVIMITGVYIVTNLAASLAVTLMNPRLRRRTW